MDTHSNLYSVSTQTISTSLSGSHKTQPAQAQFLPRHSHNPSQICVASEPQLDLALRLNRWGTLSHLLPEMKTLLTNQHLRRSSTTAVDVLIAICRINELACCTTVAFGGTLEQDCRLGVRWILQEKLLCRLRREGCDCDGRG